MEKQGFIYCLQPEQFDIFDDRICKPVCIKQLDKDKEVGSMVFLEMDEISFPNNKMSYFPPNNVGLLLSISKRQLKESKEIYNKFVNPNNVDHTFTRPTAKDILKQKSIVVANYIESIQICIVFGYTALEAFANLSIPDEFEYKMTIKNKGIIELYDKNAIERWVNLGDKFSNILTDIYDTKKIESAKFWSYFIKLEKYRHDIIHQKTIGSTAFYKTYFNKDIFEICACPELVLQFFYIAQAEKQKTNPLWPWLINKDMEFPLTTDYVPENFEVVGNIFDGVKEINK